MTKTKPNEKCPCGSDVKYKKCCAVSDRMEKQDIELKFEENILSMESKEITHPSLQRISTYFLDRYNTMSIDMSDEINTRTLNKLHGIYIGKNIFLLLNRNEANDSVFIKYGACNNDNIMVIYRKNFQCFNYGSEYDKAMSEIHKWKS